jgi:hypothetical protein
MIFFLVFWFGIYVIIREFSRIMSLGWGSNGGFVGEEMGAGG